MRGDENRSCTGELPSPKPRKAVPRREATLLVLQDGCRILMETRPPTGIWGGLLSLPELPAGTKAGEWAAQVSGCRA